MHCQYTFIYFCMFKRKRAGQVLLQINASETNIMALINSEKEVLTFEKVICVQRSPRPNKAEIIFVRKKRSFRFLKCCLDKLTVDSSHNHTHPNVWTRDLGQRRTREIGYLGFTRKKIWVFGRKSADKYLMLDIGSLSRRCNMELRGLMVNGIDNQPYQGPKIVQWLGHVMRCEENEPLRAAFKWMYREKNPCGRAIKISINGVNKYSSMVSWKEVLQDLIVDGTIRESNV